MKRQILVFVMLVGVLSGCASLRYENDNEVFVFRRAGALNLKGVEIKRDCESGISSVKFESSQGEEMGDVLSKLSEIAKEVKTP